MLPWKAGMPSVSTTVLRRTELFRISEKTAARLLVAERFWYTEEELSCMVTTNVVVVV